MPVGALPVRPPGRAAAGAGAFRAAYSAWLADDAGPGLEQRLAEALDILGAALAPDRS